MNGCKILLDNGRKHFAFFSQKVELWSEIPLWNTINKLSDNHVELLKISLDSNIP